MQWTEIITIYLAIGAPFAAIRYLRCNGSETFGRILAGMLMHLYGWPVVGARFVLRGKGANGGAKSHRPAADPGKAVRAEQLQRRITIGLSLMRKQGEVIPGALDSSFDLVNIRLRESLDRYVGLSLLDAGHAPADGPTSGEIDFFRIAGRREGELDTAASCLHRRNRARLERHRIQAGRDLVQDLSAVQSWYADRLIFHPSRHLLQQTIRNIFTTGRDLFTLFEDRSAANEIEDKLRGDLKAATNTEVSKCITPKPQIRLSIQR